MAQRKRQKRAELTKEALLESGLRLFNEHGFDAVTIEDITRAAGVAKGSFYTHFATKSDIIVEEFWNIDRYYEEYATRNFRRYLSAADRLRAFTRAQMRYVRDEVGNANLKILYANQVIETGESKIIVNRARKWYSIVQSVMELGQERGEFRSDLSAEHMAQMFNRSVRGVFLDWCITDAAFDLVKEGLAFVDDWLIYAVRGAAPPASGG